MARSRSTGRTVIVYINGVPTPCTTVCFDRWYTTNDVSLLNDYLNEAIDNEEYEDAALIRDRIKEITE
jgi:hypothetical protein